MSKKENANNLFGNKRRSQIEIDEEDENDTSSKNDKMKYYTNSSISECWMKKKTLKTKPSDNDQIARIAEDLLCQIKSMSSDVTIADLFMSSQKNHQSYWVNQKKSIRNLTSLTEIFQIILRHADGIDFPYIEQFSIWRTIFSRRDKKWNLCFFDNKNYLRIFEKVILIFF